MPKIPSAATPSNRAYPRFKPPPTESGEVRVDTGVYEGGEISMYYDSMIAKLICHGDTRQQAIEHMRDALNAFLIRGVQLEHPVPGGADAAPALRLRHLHDSVHLEEYPNGFVAADVRDDPALLAAVAAFARRRYIDRAVKISGQMGGHPARSGQTGWSSWEKNTIR